MRNLRTKVPNVNITQQMQGEVPQRSVDLSTQTLVCGIIWGGLESEEITIGGRICGFRVLSHVRLTHSASCVQGKLSPANFLLHEHAMSSYHHGL